MIINKQELLGLHRDKSSSLTLSALEAAVASVMPGTLVRGAVRFDNRLAIRDINGKEVRIEEFEKVFIVGAGKAAAGMAHALDSIFHNRIASGAITVPYGTRIRIKGISVTEASHPLPDRSGIEGTKKILNVLGKTQKNDLVFVLISGGGSALMPLPATGVSLAAKRKITNQLLRSGASIGEINAIRKHLSGVKGGQLLRHLENECTVVSLIISDVIGDVLDVIASGPTCPDKSTFAEAQKILMKYRIKTPKAPVEHITKGTNGNIQETPKPGDQIFSRVHNVLIGNNTIACAGAANYLRKQGMNPIYLGSGFDGEARKFGAFLARSISSTGNRPFAIIAGGETTVMLNRSKNGIGGRNQEIVIAYLIARKRNDVALACIGTDGIDGNSNAAGALVSCNPASVKKKDLERYIDRHDSYSALKKLNSLIFTGYTGTNVNDIAIACRAPRDPSIGQIYHQKRCRTAFRQS